MANTLNAKRWIYLFPVWRGTGRQYRREIREQARQLMEEARQFPEAAVKNQLDVFAAARRRRSISFQQAMKY